jgi:hypothetical protein
VNVSWFPRCSPDRPVFDLMNLVLSDAVKFGV